MNRTQFESVQKVRDCYWSSNFDLAFSKYVNLFEANPKAWWLAMEAIRCKRDSLPCEQRENLIIFFPEYVNNPYQQHLYSTSKAFNYKVCPLGHLAIDEQLVKATFSRNFIFHQHWLKDIYWNAFSKEAGINAIERHISILKALKSYRATICWTLHNIIDHDATTLQEELSDIALKHMAEVSNRIFIHTQGAGEKLSLQCGIDLSPKFNVLEHPLYDDLLLYGQYLPDEIKLQKLEGRRILLSVGMIRPYKGMTDLIHAFQQIILENGQGLHLIIAGRLEDPEVENTLNKLEESVRNCITLISRRVSEEELAGLMQLAHVFVTSYKKILTSGSYFLATTFAKPMVAPQKGMFDEIIKDGETGFLYDGSVDDLVKLLRHITTIPEKELAQVGDNALQANKHLTISEVSDRFFRFLRLKNE